MSASAEANGLLPKILQTLGLSRAGSLTAVLALALLPALLEVIFPNLALTERLRPILIFAVLGFGLNVVTGSCGLLNLGVAAFMAIGAYTYGILTVSVYPFQIGFWAGLLASLVTGALTGFLLGLPTLRLRGDYLAIVTLGFGEIVQDVLRNLEGITKGSQGLNPLPHFSLFGLEVGGENSTASYLLLLAIVALVALALKNLERSPVGRAWTAVRDDELAASCMGVPVVRTKLLAFAFGAAICSLAGALWASFLGSTGEPGNYDFQLSVVALCIVIVGGLGSIAGVLVGAFIMVGFNSILLVELSEKLGTLGLSGTQNVFAAPSNWKFFVLGLALIVMMRLRPNGLLPRAGAKR
jgi:branched-chain amino acid transport system permease protein